MDFTTLNYGYFWSAEKGYSLPNYTYVFTEKYIHEQHINAFEKVF